MTKAKSIIYCGLFTALIAVGAFIKIPIPVVPFTLQYLFTMLAGLLLGSRRGSLSVIAYIILGLAGLLVVYACGMIYYYVICNYVINTPIGVWPLFLYCFILAVPGDIALSILAAVLVKRIKPVLEL
ncbi:MAG: biotin transporter BioY [Clostridiaceae bacterium]|nr:biotin transporter BioY [Clostridiaceae bacterium]MDD5797290.1 biotin transporter BioY [Clostridiaceae bacterium]